MGNYSETQMLEWDEFLRMLVDFGCVFCPIVMFLAPVGVFWPLWRGSLLSWWYENKRIRKKNSNATNSSTGGEKNVDMETSAAGPDHSSPSSNLKIEIPPLQLVAYMANGWTWGIVGVGLNSWVTYLPFLGGFLISAVFVTTYPFYWYRDRYRSQYLMQVSTAFSMIFVTFVICLVFFCLELDENMMGIYGVGSGGELGDESANENGGAGQQQYRAENEPTRIETAFSTDNSVEYDAEGTDAGASQSGENYNRGSSANSATVHNHSGDTSDSSQATAGKQHFTLFQCFIELLAWFACCTGMTQSSAPLFTIMKVWKTGNLSKLGSVGMDVISLLSNLSWWLNGYLYMKVPAMYVQCSWGLFCNVVNLFTRTYFVWQFSKFLREYEKSFAACRSDGSVPSAKEDTEEKVQVGESANTISTQHCNHGATIDRSTAAKRRAYFKSAAWTKFVMADEEIDLEDGTVLSKVIKLVDGFVLFVSSLFGSFHVCVASCGRRSRRSSGSCDASLDKDGISVAKSDKHLDVSIDVDTVQKGGKGSDPAEQVVRVSSKIGPSSKSVRTSDIVDIREYCNEDTLASDALAAMNAKTSSASTCTTRATLTDDMFGSEESDGSDCGFDYDGDYGESLDMMKDVDAAEKVAEVEAVLGGEDSDNYSDDEGGCYKTSGRETYQEDGREIFSGLPGEVVCSNVSSDTWCVEAVKSVEPVELVSGMDADGDTMDQDFERDVGETVVDAEAGDEVLEVNVFSDGVVVFDERD